MKFKYTLGYCPYDRDNSKNLAEVEWSLVDGRFSASGGIWQTNKRDYTTCGQILEELLEFFPNDELLNRIVTVWRKWHLNDLTPGSPKQMEFLAQHEQNAPKTNYYEWAKDKLTFAYLNPDESFIYNGKEYEYGSAWLKTELPDTVVNEIESWKNETGVSPIN